MTAAAPALPTFLRRRTSSCFPSSSRPLHRRHPHPSRASPAQASVRLSPISAVEKTKGAAAAADEVELEGMTPEFYDEFVLFPYLLNLFSFNYTEWQVTKAAAMGDDLFFLENNALPGSTYIRFSLNSGD